MSYNVKHNLKIEELTMKYLMNYDACVRNTDWVNVYLSVDEEVIKISESDNRNIVGLFIKKNDTLNSGKFELNIASVRKN